MKCFNLSFDAILPEEIQDYPGNLIFTTLKESPKKCEKILLHEDVLEYHPTVLRGVMVQKLNLSFKEENLILGVDPGQRIGLSIFYYGIEIEKSVHNSIEELVLHIIGILGGLRAKKKF